MAVNVILGISLAVSGFFRPVPCRNYHSLMGLPKSPGIAIMLVILLGILASNTVKLPDIVEPCICFGLVRVLRFGIVLLGIRHSLAEAGAISLKTLPIIVGAMVTALFVVTYIVKGMGLSGRLGVLPCRGTSICGATAIVAMAATIRAKNDEVGYTIACITLFGGVAVLVCLFLGHWVFHVDAGQFLSTSVHETAQLAGAVGAWDSIVPSVNCEGPPILTVSPTFAVVGTCPLASNSIVAA